MKRWEKKRFFQSLIIVLLCAGLHLMGSSGARGSTYDGGLFTDADHDWSFESAVAKWTYTSTGATYGSTTREKERAKSLSYSSQTTAEDGRTIVSSKVTGITAGSNYSVSVWMLCTSATYNDVHIKLGIRWYESDDTFISESTQDTANKLILSAQYCWEQQKYENVTAPANAAKADLKIYLWDSGNDRVVFLDHTRFVAGGEVSPPDGGLLTDADHDWSFESAVAKWTYTSTGATYGSITREQERAKSLKYDSQTTAEDGRTIVSSKVTGITAGSNYSVSVWMLCTSATYNDVHIKLGIRWYESDDTFISESTQDTANKLILSAQYCWEQQKYENVTAPANAAKAELKIYLWDSGDDRVVYLDGARLVAGEETMVSIIIQKWRELYH